MIGKEVRITYRDPRFYMDAHEAVGGSVAIYQNRGVLVSQNEDETVVACEDNEVGTPRQFTYIPTSSIVRIERMRTR